MSRRIGNSRKILADNLRRLRGSRGLTQELLAEMAGVHPVFISFLENRKRNITLDYLDRLAHALKCPSHELITQYRGGHKSRG